MTHPFVRTVRQYETLPSTSDTARALVEAGGMELPLLVWTHRQTAGRGRGSNAWWSGEGSLTFTLAIDPRAHGLRPEHEPRVALAVAVAICEMLDGLLMRRVGIRWPNDVECDDRKLAGILPERVETGEGPRLLIGVGLNVFTRFDDAPEDIRAMATSVEREIYQPESGVGEVRDYLDALLEQIPGVLDRLACDDSRLADQWRHRDLLVNRFLRLRADSETIEGIGCGITPDGGLRVRPIGGFERVVYGGQVLRDLPR